MQLKSRTLRFIFLGCIAISLVGSVCPRWLLAQDQALSDEERREQVATERFLQLLLRRPATGTALERVFGYHVARGTLGGLIDGLTKDAEAAVKDGDDQAAGNHWMVIGLLQLQRGEESAADVALAKAETLLPENPLTAYHHGEALLLLGKDEAAAAAMQRAIDRKPPRRDFLNIATQLGRLYQRSDQAEKAMEIWKQLETSFPGDDGVRQRIARALADEGDYANALKRYEALAKEARSQNDRIVYALRAADLQVQLGQKDAATKRLEELLTRLRPGSYLYAEARRRIENAYLGTGDYAGLADYYEKWIEAHPDDTGAVLRLARTLSVQGRGAESQKWLEQAIERSPTDSAPRLALIDNSIAEEKFAEAAAQYEKLVELEPKNPDHLVRWGQVILEDRKRPEAERKAAAAKVWQRLADARNDEAAIQSQVADLLRGAELEDAAIAGYRKAIELAPTEPQYKEYLGEYLHRLDRHDEALPVWRSIAEGDQKTRENLVRLAEVLHQFDEPDEALKTMAAACEMNPTLTERLRYAEWLSDAGEYDNALEQLELADEQTDTVDDRDKVFAAEVRTYQASGQLAERTEEAKKQAEDAETDGELWRRLATLYDAGNQPRESMQAIEKALEHSPDSIETLDVAARMYENAGQLQTAIEKRQELADRDQRFRSGHLQRLATLYLRIGQEEKAIETGKLLLAGGGGSLESFRFYADLCGQLGRIDERLDTYRRCVRLNPRNTDAQQMLANRLASDFKTDQAIELYWNMFDSATELDARRDVVRKLTDLYLRSNRLDQLISRLEIRGRESGDRRGTVDLVATAYEQAGDLGLAREELEGLLREQGRDTLLLERLVLLAEQSGEMEEAVGLQRQLIRLAPNRQTEAKLATLLIDIGAINEAEALWLRLGQQSGNTQQTVRNINRLFSSGETKLAIRLTENSLETNPNDWEMLLRLMILQASEGEWKTAVETAEKLRGLDIKETELPEGGKPYQQTVVSGGRTFQQPPLQFMRSQRLYDLYRVLDDRYSYNRVYALPTPVDFGHAKLMALWVVYKNEQDEGRLNEHIEALAKKANADDATTEDVWDWYISIAVVSRVDSNLNIDYRNPKSWEPIWRLAEVDPESGLYALSSPLYSRWSNSMRARGVTLEPLAEDKLEWLAERAKSNDMDEVTSRYGSNFNWTLIYNTEMTLAGNEAQAENHIEQQLAQAVESKDVKLAIPLLTWATNQGSDDQLWPLIELIRSTPNNPAVKSRFPTGMASGLLGLFTAQSRIDQNLSKGPADETYRTRVLTLLDEAITAEAAKTTKSQTIRLSSFGQQRSTYMVSPNGNYQQITIPFPPQGLGPDDLFVQALWLLNEQFSKIDKTWLQPIIQTNDNDEPKLEILKKITAGIVLQWNDQTEQAIMAFSDAVKIAQMDRPQIEPDLRLMWVDLLLRNGRNRQALEVIDELTVYDQNTMAVREFAAAKLAAALGDKDRARAAAKRLFGVRLDTNTQIELARLMRSLDMHELASDMVRRMRSRGGSSTDQLAALMTYFLSQDDKAQAAEVAIELLRRSVPTRQRSSSSTTAAQAQRRSALQTLASVGRLNSLITSTEERLERSPKSQRLRRDLAELYNAAGKPIKAQELLADSVSEGLSSLRALEQAAKQLAAAGKMAEACDAYLKVLRRKPEIFSQDYYEIKRPFEREKRMADLAKLIIDVGPQKFQSYRVAELCENLSESASGKEVFKPLYLAMLETAGRTGNFSNSLNSIVDSRSEVFNDPELIQVTQEALINDSLRNPSDWNTLFNGYSTSSNGFHSNAATQFAIQIAKKPDSADTFEEAIREKLNEHNDWHVGRTWLGVLLANRQKYDEAKKLLEPLLDEDIKPAPGYEVFWLVGCAIDQEKPMQDLAAELYLYSLGKHDLEAMRTGSEFQYTMANRACQLLTEMKRNDEARTLLLESVALREKNPRTYSSNADYNAYRAILNRMSVVQALQKMEFPVDALRMARKMDMSLFDKAGRYENGYRDRFVKLRDGLMNTVREMGGLTTVELMIDETTSGLHAVDLGFTIGENPFTDNGLDSLWAELVVSVAQKDETETGLKSLVTKLEQLSQNRPKDDSAAFGSAFVASVIGDSKPLEKQLTEWATADSDEQAVAPKFRQQCMIIGLTHLSQTDSETNRQFVERFVSDHLQNWDWSTRTLLFAKLGRAAIARKNSEQASQLWSKLLEDPQGQWLLLDLAHACAQADLPKLSIDAAAAAVTASDQKLTPVDHHTGGASNGLGALLSSPDRSNSTSSSNNNEPDSAEVRFAKRLLELDDVWQTKQVTPKRVCETLAMFVFGKNGDAPINPHCVSATSNSSNNTIQIDSVFNRMARRAKPTGMTDDLLSRLKKQDVNSHLLAGLLLLTDGQSSAAAKRYAAVDSTSLTAVPKETVLQALLPALEDDACRETALKLGNAFVDQNKPTQRYQDVDPFDNLTLIIAKAAILNGHHELGMTAINDYLEINQHQNNRYSGTYGLERRIDQLNKVARLLLQRGQTGKALNFLGMRQSLFEMGLGDRHDTVAAWSTRQLWTKANQAKTYQLLADWTFAGDGPLHLITGLAHRQPLPAWIPESVSGKQHRFAPLATPGFPIVTTWQLLAKLAQAANQTDDLIARLEEAHQQKRSGAAVALAIVRKVCQQPLSESLLSEIDQQMADIAPGKNNGETMLPLPTMQLAVLLADSSEHTDWARKTTESFAAHAGQSKNAFVRPWLLHFQHQQGWTENEDLQNASDLPNWLPSSLAPVGTYVQGLPSPVWLTDGQSQVNHVYGLKDDRLWFRLPLTGDFEFQIEISEGQNRGIALVANGVQFLTNASGKYIDISPSDRREWIRYRTNTLKPNQWHRHTLRFASDTFTFLIDDTEIYQEPRNTSSPWIALHAPGPQNSSSRNLKVTGEPSIARDVNLLSGDTLRGWDAQYFGEPLPTASLNRKAIEKDVADPSIYRTASNPDELSQLAWTVKDEELISGQMKITNQIGPASQSVIRYQRPLGEGETLSYQFYYQPQEFAVHPAIGRTAYMLHPDGLKRHWMIESGNQWKVPKDFEAPVEGSENLPLKAGEWNDVSLKLEDGRLKISLNNQSIYDEPHEPLPQGNIVGLFHYANKTKARVRNITLTGNWPEEMPENLLKSQK